MLCRVLGTVLGGLVIVAVLVLAGCEEPPTPGAAAAARLVGEWQVLEYLTWFETEDGTLASYDLMDEQTMTMAFSASGRLAITIDGADHNSESVGSYELLDDERILIELASGGGVRDFSVTATTLTITWASGYGDDRPNKMTARRM